MPKNENTATIAKLNDLLRDTFLTGRVIMTAGVAPLGEAEREAVITAVRTFNDFTEDNDPHSEHDFGSFTCCESRYNWKIDYFDEDMQFHSPNPADPSVTKRVLTIMRVDEY